MNTSDKIVQIGTDLGRVSPVTMEGKIKKGGTNPAPKSPPPKTYPQGKPGARPQKAK
jgi:hypothetical protein